MRAWLRIWVSPGCVAIRCGRSHLGCRRGPAVAGDFETNFNPKHMTKRFRTRFPRVILLAAPMFLGAGAVLRPAFVLAQSQVGSTSPDSAAVASVVNRYHAALSAGDSTAALELLAPDVMILESGGVETRAEYRSHHLGGDIAFAKAVPSVRAPMTIRVVGDVAWTVSTSSTKGQYKTRAINSVGTESMVLSRTTDGWRIRSIHWSSRSRTPR